MAYANPAIPYPRALHSLTLATHTEVLRGISAPNLRLQNLKHRGPIPIFER